jgi:hypothetical protein
MLLTLRNVALIFFGVAGITSSFARQNVERPPGTQIVSSEHLWKATLLIGKDRRWRKEAILMEISPKRVGSTIYIPYDLSDAWRDLDAMLPRQFISVMVSHTDRDTCAINLDRETGVVHDAMTGFISDTWLYADDTVYSKYIYKTFDLDPRKLKADSGYSVEVRSLAAAWTLCSYYHFKQSRGHPDLNELLDSFREELRGFSANANGN